MEEKWNIRTVPCNFSHHRKFHVKLVQIGACLFSFGMHGRQFFRRPAHNTVNIQKVGKVFTRISCFEKCFHFPGVFSVYLAYHRAAFLICERFLIKHLRRKSKFSINRTYHHRNFISMLSHAKLQRIPLKPVIGLRSVSHISACSSHLWHHLGIYLNKLCIRNGLQFLYLLFCPAKFVQHGGNDGFPVASAGRK